jgi:hypothetical protein
VPIAQQSHRAWPDDSHGAVFTNDREGQSAPPDRLLLADVLEELKVCVATAERDVLAIVGGRARIAVAFGKGLDSSAQVRACLEKRHVMPPSL